ncbi:MAG: hypothetical protein AAF995_07755 [Planctomycetota bacterium]
MPASLRTFVVAFVIALLGFALGGCGRPLTIAPPMATASPARVYVVDYGDSARLLLPRRTGRWVEYGYGDWACHAIGKHLPPTGLAAGLFPARAALCRREHEVDPTPWMRAETIVPITVERELAWDLLDQLDFEFLRNAGTLEVDIAAGIRWVEDPRKYSAWNHAGHRIGDWLVDLGCLVEGASLSPRIRLDSSVAPGGPELPDGDILVSR